MLSSSPARAQPVLGQRYALLGRIGGGGCADVYEAVDTRTNRVRAVKVLREAFDRDAKATERFQNESVIAGRVETEHLVQVLDAGVDEEQRLTFMVMERLRGEDLEQRIRRQGRLTKDEVLLYLEQVAVALEHLHDEQIIHRDIKPSNVFITKRNDGTPLVKLLDLGVAKFMADATGDGTAAIGTPLYMAPEQVRGARDVDARADLYALAHLAYALLVGEPYYREERTASGSLFAFLGRISEGQSEPAHTRASRLGVTLPAAFSRWMAKSAAVEPSLRFDSAVEQIASLKDVLLEEHTERGLSVHIPAPQRKPRSHRVVAVGALAIVAAAAVAVVGAPFGRVTAARPAQVHTTQGSGLSAIAWTPTLAAPSPSATTHEPPSVPRATPRVRKAAPSRAGVDPLDVL